MSNQTDKQKERTQRLIAKLEEDLRALEHKMASEPEPTSARDKATRTRRVNIQRRTRRQLRALRAGASAADWFRF